MKFVKLILFVCFSAVALTACKKEVAYDFEKQLAADTLLIKEFIAKNNIPALRHESGVYYQIIEPGTGNVNYTGGTVVKANYTLRLLNGSQIEKSSNPIQFPLRNVIPGWQIGVPLIQQGGAIRLFIPSVYAYQNTAQGSIPANSVLDFDIELIEVD